MSKLLRSVLVAILCALCLNVPHVAAAEGPYDETARPADDMVVALKQAHDTGQRVLLVFGANWCVDCRKLDAEFKTGTLATLIARDYVVVKVDVGRFDKNLDVVALYPKVIAKGIPSIAVVTARNEIVHVAQGGELADARRMKASEIEKYFDELSRKSAGR
jgi:protein disulfide-isomerase